MNLRQAAQQALEALERINAIHYLQDLYEALDWEIDALRAALAEHEQEPVAWVNLEPWMNDETWPDDCFSHEQVTGFVPLYTAPTPRKPLTDEEIDRVTDQQWAQNNHKPIYAAHRAYARAIERAHGIGDSNGS